eukprot:m51a1_g745 putative elf1p (162) ;mRNA; r:511078-511694
MGKRKKARKPPPRRVRAKLATMFDCPFCNHEGTVTFKLDKSSSTGTLHCNMCDVEYSTQVKDPLTEGIDVYYEWIDEATELNRGVNPEADDGEAAAAAPQPRATITRGGGRTDDSVLDPVLEPAPRATVVRGRRSAAADDEDEDDFYDQDGEEDDDDAGAD